MPKRDSKGTELKRHEATLQILVADIAFIILMIVFAISEIKTRSGDYNTKVCCLGFNT